MNLNETQPAVIWEKPPALAVQMEPVDEGLGWHITAMNTTSDVIEGDVQIEWRLPAAARDKVLVFSTNQVDVQRQFVVDSLVLSRPESFIHLWIGERFTVSLLPGEMIELSGTLVGTVDIDQDGAIDSGDVTSILSAWGETCCQADVNCDGIVQIEDLEIVLAALGG